MVATEVLGTLILMGALLVWGQLHILRGLLATRGWKWPVWVALFFPPAAPVLAWRAGMRARAMLWLVAAALYGAARAVVG